MRIRKRQVPLPLSSLLPVPLSDLYFNRSPTATTAPFFCGQDRDGVLASLLQLPPPPLPVTDRLIHRDVMRNNEKKALDEDDDVDVKSSTDASGSKNVNPQGESDSSTQVVEKNEKGVTLRKRRSFISFEEEGDEGEEEEASGSKKGKKRAKKSGALEEGSRCSRVNGRGWRCCQQTLYGYSLCEHHLGKGRVRSMNKSAGRRGGDKKPVVTEVKKKRVKLGMVKARSISSLLGQASTSSGIADVVVAVGSEISAPADQYADYDK
ncbi:Growth-regulating factor [Hirschfeldia incana]|nr:Growth-regulating factor [Hirschfeldia incana]